MSREEVRGEGVRVEKECEYASRGVREEKGCEEKECKLKRSASRDGVREEKGFEEKACK